MNSRASTRFWRLYHQLPPEIQRLADKNYRLRVTDHWHPSLHFKKVKWRGWCLAQCSRLVPLA